MKTFYISSVPIIILCVFLLLSTRKKQEPIYTRPWGTVWRESIEPGYIPEDEPIYLESNTADDGIKICHKCPAETTNDGSILICPGHSDASEGKE